MITPEGLALLSKKECRRFKENHNSNTQLAFMLDVNFEIVECNLVKQSNVNPVKAMLPEYYNNIFKEIRMKVMVIKHETLWGYEVKR
jgi:hypothetical protein